MRADMAKVLVERPRPGSRFGSLPGKGYAKRAQDALRTSLDTGDSPPNREPHWQRYGYGRCFNENLSPLRRYLHRHVGRPWNKVHSEICQHIDRGNVVQKHILTHLYQYVAINVSEQLGEVYYSGSDHYCGRLLGETHFELYVCPRTGLLRRVKTVPRRQLHKLRQERWAVRQPECRYRIAISATSLVMLINTRWELVTVRPLPPHRFRVLSNKSDVILNCKIEALSFERVRKFYGDAVFAIDRRPLPRHEQRRYAIPLDLIQ
jgi:hypothetical protein